jgi:hypothetical protein
LSDVGNAALEEGLNLGVGGAALGGLLGGGGKLIRDILKTPTEPVAMYKEGTPSQKPVAMYKETAPSQQPVAMYKETAPSQQPVAMYKEGTPESIRSRLSETPTTETVQPKLSETPITEAPTPKDRSLEGGFLNFNRPKQQKLFTYQDPVLQAKIDAADGVKPKSIFTKASEALTEFKNLSTRTFKNLPETPEFAEAKQSLVKIGKLKGLASQESVDFLDDLVNTYGKDYGKHELLTDKVMLDDFKASAARGEKLPWDMKPQTVDSELQNIDNILANHPDVQQALAKRKQYWDNTRSEYIDAMKKIGINMSDRFQREDYFRHQVLKYAQDLGLRGTGNSVKAPSTARGSLQTRSGSDLPINRNYLQVEHEVLTQIKHDTKLAQELAKIKDVSDIAPQIRQSLQGTTGKPITLKDVKNAIPPGYTTFQPKEGNLFFMANTVDGKIANDLLKGTLQTANITVDDLGTVLARGLDRETWVIPEELAATLRDLGMVKADNIAQKVANQAMNKLKGWFLRYNPLSVSKVQLRNAFSDIEGTIQSNPKLLFTPKGWGTLKVAAKDIYWAATKKKFSPDLQAFKDMGGLQDLYVANEMGDINNLKEFIGLNKSNVADFVKAPWRGYKYIMNKIGDNRELVLRYANFLSFKGNIQSAGGGKLKNYGASRREIIDVLKNTDEKAYKLSKDAIGAYDEATGLTAHLAKYWVPFARWNEIIAKREFRLLINAYKDEQGSITLGRGLAQTLLTGVTVPTMVALRLGRFFALAGAMSGAMALWNQTKYPDLEANLAEEIQKRPHLVLGKDEETGDTRYLDRLSGVSDLLGWFGADAITSDVKDYLDGKKSVKEIAMDMLKAPLNKAVSAVTPLVKTPVELLTGKKSYPDITRGSPVRDKGLHTAQSVGLGEPYKYLTNLPQKKKGDIISNAFFAESNPEEAAYFRIKDLARKFEIKKQGYESEESYNNPRTNALYNYRMAIKYGDTKAADKAFNKFIELGGTQKGLNRSMDLLQPLAGLNKRDRREFIMSLSPKELDVLDTAERHFRNTLMEERENRPRLPSKK